MANAEVSAESYFQCRNDDILPVMVKEDGNANDADEHREVDN